MKDVGRTGNDGYLVELSSSEYDTLVYLERVMYGESFEAIRQGFNREYEDLDLSHAFKAIRTWVEGMCFINSLQNYTNRLKETFHSTDDK